MGGKRRTLDLEEVEAALKRAAWAGLYGTAEERSGRFVVREERSGAETACVTKEGEKDGANGMKWKEP